MTQHIRNFHLALALAALLQATAFLMIALRWI